MITSQYSLHAKGDRDHRRVTCISQVLPLIPLDPVTVLPGADFQRMTGLMVIWWVTEAIPIYATALALLVLFPLLGVLCPRRQRSGNETVFLSWAGSLLRAAMVR